MVEVGEEGMWGRWGRRVCGGGGGGEVCKRNGRWVAGGLTGFPACPACGPQLTAAGPTCFIPPARHLRGGPTPGSSLNGMCAHLACMCAHLACVCAHLACVCSHLASVCSHLASMRVCPSACVCAHLACVCAHLACVCAHLACACARLNACVPVCMCVCTDHCALITVR